MEQISPIAIKGPPSFDYREMDAATADEAQAVVSRYRVRARAYVMDTGRDLLAMKERLEHGLFMKWVEGALGMTPRSAQNYMQAASVLGDKSETVSHLPPTILYKLAAASTPDPVRAEIVQRLEGGEALTPKAIDAQLWEARSAARREEADAKLAPEERKRRAQAKKASEARRQREHQKSLAEWAEREALRKAEAEELAGILAPLLDADTYRRVYELIHRVNSADMREALADSWSRTEIGLEDSAQQAADLKARIDA